MPVACFSALAQAEAGKLKEHELIEE